MSEIEFIKKARSRIRRSDASIFKNVDREGWDPSLAMYETEGGYDQLKKAVGMEPGAITEEVKKAGRSRTRWCRIPRRREMGFHPTEQRPSRSTSSATPTSRSPAHSRTATSFTRIRTS